MAKLPCYDLAMTPTRYEHEQRLMLKNLSFERVADALTGENLLSTLFTILFFFLVVGSLYRWISGRIGS